MTTATIPTVIWQCLTCGEFWEGTGKGNSDGMVHCKRMKKKGETHDVVLKVKDTGEMPLTNKGTPIKSVIIAQKYGFMAKPLKEGEILKKETPIPSAAIRGRTTPIMIDIDPRAYFLYEWDKLMWPDYTKTFGEWVWECILGFHIQNRQSLRFDILFGLGESKVRLVREEDISQAIMQKVTGQGGG